MALASTTLQPVTNSEPAVNKPDHSGSILAALVLSVYAAQRSRKQLRKLKRKAMFSFLKLKLQHSWNSLFNRKKIAGISNTTLLYILLGLIVLILLFTLPPLVAIIVLLIGVLLILLTRH
jgi:hypothetical protein